MLRPDRETDRVLSDPLSQKLLFRELRVGRRRGMDHKALHIRHICQKREDLQVIDELPGLFLSSLDLKCENGCSAVREIPLIKLMIRMPRQRRMVDLLYCRMILQILHNFPRILGMSVQSQGKRLNALQKKKSVEWRNRRSRIP